MPRPTRTAEPDAPAPTVSPADQPAGRAALPVDPWEALRAPFPADEIEKLPKQVRKDDRDRFDCKADHANFRKASKDGVACGGWHAYSVHLDYVGHAGITTRLNEAVGTENWNWEPAHLTLPEWVIPLFAQAVSDDNLDRAAWLLDRFGRIDYRDGGMWIRLTILGHTKLGFGDAAGKTGPNATKEIIGDAIRNAAMRFGVGTYLWSKSEKSDRLRDPDLVAHGDSGQPPRTASDTVDMSEAPAPDVVQRAVEGIVAQVRSGALTPHAGQQVLLDLRKTHGQPVLERVGPCRFPNGETCHANDLIGGALHFVSTHRPATEQQPPAAASGAPGEPHAAGDVDGEAAALAAEAAKARLPESGEQQAAADEAGQRIVEQGEQANARAAAARSSAAQAEEHAGQRVSPKQRLLQPWLNEIAMQAGILDVAPADYIRPLLHDAGAPEPRLLPLTATKAWTVGQREKVIADLQEQNPTAAAVYRSISATDPAPPAVVFAPDPQDPLA